MYHYLSKFFSCNMIFSFAVLINITAFASFGSPDNMFRNILFVLGGYFIYFLYCIYKIEKIIDHVKTWQEGDRVVYNPEDMPYVEYKFEYADRNRVYLRRNSFSNSSVYKISYAEIDIQGYEDYYINLSAIDRIEEQNKKQMESKLQKLKNNKY